MISENNNDSRTEINEMLKLIGLNNRKNHYPNEVSEMALAHSQGDKTQEAYKRTDLLEKRKPLMENWANYCIEGKNVA